MCGRPRSLSLSTSRGPQPQLGQPTVKAALVPLVRIPDRAVRVYVPFLLIEQDEKAAVPEDAPRGFAAHVSVVPPGVPVTLRVIPAVLVVTVLPFESCTTTTGWVAKIPPDVEFDGLAMNATRVAAPGPIVMAVLVPAESAPDVATSV